MARRSSKATPPTSSSRRALKEWRLGGHAFRRLYRVGSVHDRRYYRTNCWGRGRAGVDGGGACRQSCLSTAPYTRAGLNAVRETIDSAFNSAGNDLLLNALPHFDAHTAAFDRLAISRGRRGRRASRQTIRPDSVIPRAFEGLPGATDRDLRRGLPESERQCFGTIHVTIRRCARARARRLERNGASATHSRHERPSSVRDVSRRLACPAEKWRNRSARASRRSGGLLRRRSVSRRH